MSDPEIEAMSAIAGSLQQLSPEAQGRVLRWAAERFEVTLRSQRIQKNIDSSHVEHSDESQGDDEESESTGAEAAEYEFFADLFDAAGPTSEADKALVGAYWFQVVQGQATFQSQSLNAELKNLGHAIGNVTQALSSLQSRKPALVVQVRKAGNARQARKTFKVTAEGIRAVRQMLAK